MKEKPDAILALILIQSHLTSQGGHIRGNYMVYIHLANSLDHDVMCSSLIFPHQKTCFRFWWPGGNPSPDLVSKCNKSCLESSGIALKESHPESEQNQPIVVQLLSNCPALACANNNVFLLLQQGCDLRWETASARLGFAQALAVKCGLSSMSQLWHGNEFLKEFNPLEGT